MSNLDISGHITLAVAVAAAGEHSTIASRRDYSYRLMD